MADLGQAVSGWTGIFRPTFTYNNLYRAVQDDVRAQTTRHTARLTATHPTSRPAPQGGLIVMSPQQGGVRG